MKILIVDDSRAMRRIVARTVRQAGYDGHEMIEAGNGREALAMVRAERPDLVLSDWHMPEMDGLELLQALNDDRIAAPFGFIASSCTTEMVDQAAAAGALFLLLKPFTAEDMAQVLGAVLPAVEAPAEAPAG